MPNKEFKFRSLAEFKATDEGPGGYQGYPTLWDEIDEGGDLIPRGAYLETIDSYLKSGFSAHSHEWSISGAIGYPMKAVEDDKGFYIETKFHSTPDAQLVRTKAQERIADGKQVGLSIGFQASEPPLTVYPKDYKTELPKYVSPEAVERTLARAAQFSKIRVLSKIELFEVSIVTAPMLKVAQVTGVKSGEDKTLDFNVKGMFEEQLAEDTNEFGNLCRTLGRVLTHLFYMSRAAQGVGAVLDEEARLDESLNEFVGRVRESYLSARQAGEYWDAYIFYGRTEAETKQPTSAEAGALAASTFAEHSETVLAAAQGVITRAKSIRELRTKEGRTLSQANRTRLSSLLESLTAMASDIETLLSETEPKEKAAPDLVRRLVVSVQETRQRLRASKRAV